MATFHLKVLTVDKQFFDGEVDRIVVRTSQGDVGILPNHVPYVAALGVGGLTIIRERRRPCSGGFGRFCGCFGRADGRAGAYLRVGRRNRRGPCREAADRAKAILQKKAGDREMDIAQGKLKKAVNRIRIAESK